MPANSRWDLIQRLNDPILHVLMDGKMTEVLLHHQLPKLLSYVLLQQ